MMSIHRPLLQSLALHLGLMILAASLVWLVPKDETPQRYRFTVQEKVIERAQEKPPETVALDISQQPRPTKPAPVPAKRTFGINKNTLVSDSASAVGVKSGNTIAKAMDNELSDGEALPVAIDEFLVTKMPRLKKEVRLPYPAEAKSQGVEGTVILEILIDETGKVRSARLLQGVGAGLDEAALEAIRGFEFEPARMENKSVAVKIRYAYKFVLD